jgi:surface antigen
VSYRVAFIGLALIVALAAAYWLATHINPNPNRNVGDVVDQLDGVAVHYNGAVNHSQGRNLSADGYNLGIKYQCVEFVKRYYFERFHHRMPDTMGHAKDFFDHRIADGALNPARNLVQFKNGGASAPRAGDIVVFDRWLLNPYGHVAIIAAASDDEIEIIQQNPGPFSSSRETFKLLMENGRWSIPRSNILGWLRRQ